jgi:hypothetical protein
MKTMIIIIFLSFYSCFGQVTGIDTSRENRVIWIINQIFDRSNNLDSLKTFLYNKNICYSKSVILHSYTYFTESTDTLSKHIINYFSNHDYFIEKEGVFDLDSMKSKIYEVKVRNAKTKEIIIFVFFNDFDIWKLDDIRFCNNERGLAPDEPCYNN